MAHIPDGFLSGPVLAGSAAASVAALAAAARRSRATLGEREGPVLGAITAFVFAAQMLNFPLGIGASAHLLGGALVAVLLGPWAGMLVLFAVLLVQALLFQDGGIAALGANTLNVAVLGVGSAYGVYRTARALLGNGPRGVIVSAVLAAWVSTLLVGLAVSAELALSGLLPARTAVLLVGGGHAVIGIAEGVITGLLVAFVLRTRPELITRRLPDGAPRRRALAIAGTAAMLAALAIVAASTQPDVLESVLAALEPRAAPTSAAPFPDYSAAVGGAWVAGAVGLAAAFLVAWGLAVSFARRRR